jgi:hypothetical protein
MPQFAALAVLLMWQNGFESKIPKYNETAIETAP